MANRIFEIIRGDGPLVAAAIHSGHALDPDVEAISALTDRERLREEDPFTDEFAAVADTRIIGVRSRFEIDLNRPPDGAVYLKPEDAWGLDLWIHPPEPHLIDRSVARYESFYEAVRDVLDEKVRRFGSFVVYDLHSYNHRRQGPDGEPDDPDLNPEVNVGTGTMDRARWEPVVDTLIESLRTADFKGRRLDVRENVKFFGGYFSEWIHKNYPETGCAPAIEFKKIFMDEWTGEPDRAAIAAIRRVLEATVEPVLAALQLPTTGQPVR